MIGIPERVQRFADNVVETVGIEPAIEFVAGYWLITLTAPRVVATARFKHSRGRGGRWSWHDGTLTVDGEPRPVTNSMEELARLVADPDGRAAAPAPLPASEPPGKAPAAVQRDFWAIARKLGTDAVTVGCDGKRWVVALEMTKPSGATASLRINYANHAHRWIPDPYRPFTLILDGRDRTSEINNLAEAMALMAGQSEPGEPGTGGVAGAAEATGFGSVDVRRHSVIRN
jgi:hypothetical protein